MDIQKYSYVVVNCGGFSTAQEFISRLWGILKSKEWKYVNIKKVNQFENSLNSFPRPYSFNQLHEAIRFLLANLNRYCTQSTLLDGVTMCILLDQFDHLQNLPGGNNIAYKLLTLPSVSEIIIYIAFYFNIQYFILTASPRDQYPGDFKDIRTKPTLSLLYCRGIESLQ